MVPPTPGSSSVEWLSFLLAVSFLQGSGWSKMDDGLCAALLVIKDISVAIQKRLWFEHVSWYVGQLLELAPEPCCVLEMCSEAKLIICHVVES